MARMYSRKKGKSASTKPTTKAQPTWLRYKAKEVEMLITKMAKEGKTTSEIGIILRDTYGIPDVKMVTKKSILKILKEKNLTKELPEDLFNLIKRYIQIKKHLEENKKDMPALRGLQLTESKMRRLVKYYKERDVLPKDWKYDEQSIRMYVG
jgi:small subunit ribosomal protein S15